MKPNRNDPCPCGSGKKYKHCCERKISPPPVAGSPSLTELNQLIALFNAGRLIEAEQQSRSLTEKFPTLAVAWKLLGVCLNSQGKAREALPALLRAAELLPNDAEAHYNLGVTQVSLGQLDDAVASYRRSLTLKPDDDAAHNNLGNTLRELGRIDEAITSCRQALKIKPDYFATHSNLLLSLNCIYTAPSDYLTEALRYGANVAQKVPARFADWQCAPQPQRLRVGIVSGDLRNHPVGYFIEDILTQLDNTRIELIAYTSSPKEGDLTLRIKPHFAHWREIYALDDPSAAGLIHSDGVHILIDLSGHTSHNRLPVFAWKPAPVQCTWLGLPTTTGVAEIDYILGDPIATPPEDAAHFSEQIWRLPESYLCLSTPDATLQVNALPALTNGYITFASFNNLSKMNDATVSLWARILIALPDAKLLLKTKQFKDPAVIRTTLQRFAAQGIATDRLILEGQTPRRDNHLATYWRADIALDPFPYPGVTTSAEALWMGVPVLTLQGDRFMSRTAASIAHNVGLPGWIAASEDDYVAKAVRFAGDLPELSALRDQLRGQVRASPLFDAPRFAKHFEAALWGMWRAKGIARVELTPYKMAGTQRAVQSNPNNLQP